MKFIVKYFLQLIIGVLLILLLLSRCNKPEVDVPEPVIIRDTTWISHIDTVFSKPVVIYTKPDHHIDTTYLPNPDYIKLKKQYQDLLTLYFNTNVSQDTLKIDSIGAIYVTDWVHKNLIESRQYTYDIKHPVIKETIIIPVKPKNQIYIGGSIQGSLVNPVSQINAGLILKNKKDQLFGVYTGINMHGELQLGLQSYWKIHFGK